jgi:hypothetical protein
MQSREFTMGKGRTRVLLKIEKIGDDTLAYIYNSHRHIGAVALGEYDMKTKRTSTSVITRVGHKDDVLAQQAAHFISKATRKPSCVIAGLHTDAITSQEIQKVLENANLLVEQAMLPFSNKGSQKATGNSLR